MSLTRLKPDEPPRTTPDAIGPGAAAPTISPRKRQPSDPGAKASVTKDIVAEPPPAAASKPGVTKGEA